MLLRRFVLEQGRIELVDDRVSGGFRTQIDPLNIELAHISTLPEDRGDYSLSARTGIGANVRWKGNLGLNPLAATGELDIDSLFIERVWAYLKSELNMTPPRGAVALKLAYRVSYADRKFNLALDRVSASIDKLALAGVDDPAPRIVLDALRLDGGRFDLASREASVESLTVERGQVAIRLDATGRPELLNWLAPRSAASAASTASAHAPSAAPTAAASAPAPWRIGIGRVGVDHVSVSVLDRSFAAPMTTEVGALQLQFKAKAELGAEEPRVEIEGLGVHALDLGVTSGGEKKPWLRLASLEVQDGSLDLAGRQLALARVAVNGGLVEVAHDAHGALSVLKALERSPGHEGTHAAPPRPGATAASSERPWHFRIGKVEADRMALALREESITPAVRLDIEDLSAATEGVSEDLKAELPVRLRFRVKQGGSFDAGGRVSLVPAAADLHLKVADLALTPAQPFLAQRTNLVLTDGKASLQGRLRYRGDKATYEGGFAVRKLQLKEAGTDEPILGWQSLSSGRMTATQERLRIGELALDGLVSKLEIFKDRSVNIAKLLKPASKADAARPAPVKVATKTANARPYRLDVDRVHITNGEMDFSDQSLALPFGARIHELKGYLIGLSSVPGPPAQLEVDGKVDEYGLARAVGQIDPFDPTGFTDIKVVFRNVEMTTLTPYSATFAGRKIESGKLSLDLEYKIKERQLAGDNRIVMDQLTLGERVQSPTAMNLPLDLALAILKDADGKIDLGLPVSGSLDDPQFSYGQIVWKAIVNVVTKIVSAPFRALGSNARRERREAGPDRIRRRLRRAAATRAREARQPRQGHGQAAEHRVVGPRRLRSEGRCPCDQGAALAARGRAGQRPNPGRGRGPRADQHGRTRHARGGGAAIRQAVRRRRPRVVAAALSTSQSGRALAECGRSSRFAVLVDVEGSTEAALGGGNRAAERRRRSRPHD